MTLKDLIDKKDYDYVSYRLTLPEKIGGEDTFAGCFKSENGVIITLDGDIYDKTEEVLAYEEWENEEENIKNGLTVICKGEWN